MTLELMHDGVYISRWKTRYRRHEIRVMDVLLERPHDAHYAAAPHAPLKLGVGAIRLNQ